MKNEQTRELVGLRVRIHRRGKKGIYTACFWHGDQHVRRSLRTSNKKVARLRAMEIERQISDGEFIDQCERVEKVLMETAINAFVTFHETEGSRPKTITKYRGILNRFREFVEQKRKKHLEDVRLELIDQYRSLRTKEIAAKTMNLEGALLKSFFEWCLDRDWIKANPLSARKFKPPKSKAKDAPSLAQVDEILTEASEIRSPVLAVLAFTGMRSGEAQRLQPQDVDLKENWIHIVSREGAETKTGESRKVPIHPRLRPILEAIPSRRRPYFFTALPSKKYPDGNHHISTKRINEDLKEVLESLGLPVGRDDGFTVHSLRHFFRTFTVNAGVPERVVDNWLGHAPDKSMGSLYYHLSDEDSQKFMKQVPFE